MCVCLCHRETEFDYKSEDTNDGLKFLKNCLSFVNNLIIYNFIP